MTSACRGMVYLQSRGVIHRDLAARNLLVSNVDGQYVVKVADFGLSRETTEYATEGSMIHTMVTLISCFCDFVRSAPEVLQNKPATSQSDVFSFGIVMYEVSPLFQE